MNYMLVFSKIYATSTHGIGRDVECMEEMKYINTYGSTTLQEIDHSDLVVAARIILKRTLKVEWNMCWIDLTQGTECRRTFVITVMETALS
jgi:hypothetical protein